MIEIKSWNLEIKEFIFKHFDLRIDDVYYFECALTHRSYFQIKTVEKYDDYDALEFLGDSIISLIISNNLFLIGQTSELMTKIRQQIIQSKSLVFASKKIGLNKLIRVGPSLKNEVPDSIVEDTFESFVAAVYLSLGIENAKKFINNTLWTNFKNHELDFIFDYKTLLQEIVQKTYKTPIIYKSNIIFEKDKKKYQVFCQVENFKSSTYTDTQLKEAENLCAKDIIIKYLSKN